MPIAIDPAATQKIILDSDKKLSRPPVAICRVLTGRLQRKILGLLAELSAAEDPVVGIDKAFEALRLVFLGWENLPAAANGDLEDFLTASEAIEIVTSCLSGAGLTPEDKKKFGSGSALETGQSVPNAPGPNDAK